MANRALTAALLSTALATVAGCGRAPEPVAEETATEVQVEVSRIERTTLHAAVQAFGRVEPAPARDGTPAAGAAIGAPAAGLVVEVLCAEGDRVAAGDVLFRMDTRAAEARAERARQSVTFAEQELERQQTLIRDEGTSQRALQEAASNVAVARAEVAAAETDLALLTLRSPLGGVVTRVLVRPGEAVDVNRPLGEVIDLGRLVVAAEIPAVEAAALAPGQRVEYDTGGEGEVVYVAAAVDPRTDTIRIRASLPPGSGLRPGTFTRLRVVYEERSDRLVVPRASIVRDSEGRDAIALVENDRAVLHAVEVGLVERDRVEIAGAGIEPGSIVITAGAWGLPDGSRVRVTTER